MPFARLGWLRLGVRSPGWAGDLAGGLGLAAGGLVEPGQPHPGGEVSAAGEGGWVRQAGHEGVRGDLADAGNAHQPARALAGPGLTGDLVGQLADLVGEL